MLLGRLDVLKLIRINILWSYSMHGCTGNRGLCNEVIVYRVMMFVNPLLIYRPCTLLSKVNQYITVFLEIFRWRFVFHVTIKIHYSFIVCRIPFSQEDKLLQSFTEQYFIVNKLFWENWVKCKIQNLHLYSESVLHIWYLYCINRP